MANGVDQEELNAYVRCWTRRWRGDDRRNRAPGWPESNRGRFEDVRAARLYGTSGWVGQTAQDIPRADHTNLHETRHHGHRLLGADGQARHVRLPARLSESRRGENLVGGLSGRSRMASNLEGDRTAERHRRLDLHDRN